MIRSLLTIEQITQWCQSMLGSAIAEIQFETGNLARVVGVTLLDQRRIVIKIRPWQDRLVGCVAVQRHLALAGYPCPMPMASLEEVDGWAVHAESLVPGGEQRSPALGAGAYAMLLRQLVATAPDAGCIPSLLPSVPWTAWDHPADTIWPARDDRDIDLNLFDGPAWVDDAAKRVRELLAGYHAPLRVGHGDWESQNIRWHGGSALVVHDWDSVIAQPEAAIVGFAAAVWAAQGGPGETATVSQTEDFIEAYAQAGDDWSGQDRAVAWSAGLWVRLFNAKKDATDGGGPQLERLRDEVNERLSRAGLKG